jgi:hypothetical protein
MRRASAKDRQQHMPWNNLVNPEYVSVASTTR